MSKRSSLARDIVSLGPWCPRFPLLPVLPKGCPITSTNTLQYPLEIDYAYPSVDRELFEQPPLPGLARWSPLLPPLEPRLSLGEGGTPLVELGKHISGAPIVFKDESRNPTGSHKDRLNLCTTSAAKAMKAAGVVVASSGNHGVAAAAYAARAGLSCLVLTPPDISGTFVAMLEAYGAFVAPVPVESRWALMNAVVETSGFHPVSNLTDCHTGHPWGPEGYKTLAYELFLQLDRQLPGAVLIPTGYGELLYGIYKGFRELTILGLTRHIPTLYSVEPATRAPLAQAVHQGLAIASVAALPTRQLSTACLVNGYRGVVALRESGGRPLVVTDDAVSLAQDRLRKQGLWQEFSGASAYAALEQLSEAECGATIVVVGTSSGIKDPNKASDLRVLHPSLDALREHFKNRLDL